MQDSSKTRQRLAGEVAELRQRVARLEQEKTHHERVEQTLRESEERFRAICENAPVMIDCFDADGRCLLWNKECERVFGWSQEEITAMDDPLARIYPEPGLRDRVLRRVVEADGTFGDEEAQAHTKDGAVRTQLWANFRLSSGVIICVGYDITERKKADNALRESEARVRHAQKLESLGVLAGGIAHDFNNLLAVIQGNAELAMLDLSDERAVRLSMDEIRKASARAAELTHQMLAYAGRGKFVVEPVNLSRLVRDMADLLKISIAKKIRMEYELAESPPMIAADAAQVRQVVMNLITNAAEAIGEEAGAITLTTGVVDADRTMLSEAYFDDELPEGRYVFLRVSDTGRGMDSDVRSRLFDPFFSTKFTGRGLGLAAVLGIVRAHQGAIRIDSSVGRGTAFDVLLPCGAQIAPAAAPARDEAPESLVAWRAEGTALVVDDEQAVRAMAARMLRDVGFNVLTACNGREAVEVFAEHADGIVVVLLDLTMPEMGGEEAFAALRTIRPDVPVVLCSGYTEEDAAARFAGKGLSGFLHKPFDFDAMVAHLHHVLNPND